jgi:hypothetical protein
MAEQRRSKVRITTRSENREAVPRCPEQEADRPLLKPKANSGCERAVDDGEPTWCAGEQDRGTERTMDRDLEAWNVPGS